MKFHAVIQEAIATAIAAVHPGLAIQRYLRRDGDVLWVQDKSYLLSELDVRLVAVGKGAIPMAEALAELVGDVVSQALVITKSDHIGQVQLPSHWQVLEAAHPVPDKNSVLAGDRVMQLIRDCTERSLIIAGISGGASALLVAPEPHISLKTLQTINEALLKSGVDIQEMNAVRSRLDQLKGGGFVQLAQPGQVLGFILSDVIGDAIPVIASGLTHHPKAQNWLVGNNAQACMAAAQVFEREGYQVKIVTTDLAGEAQARGRDIAQQIVQQPAGTVLIYGGETTVTIPPESQGRGGRNQELALGAAIALGQQSIPATLVTLATDGTDGPTDAAGAIVDTTTISQALNQGLDPQSALEQHDSYPLLAQLGCLIKTHPTGTNVADLAIAITPQGNEPV